jgi:hypothetical protein
VDDVLNQLDTSKMQSSFWTELQGRKETAQGCYQELIDDLWNISGRIDGLHNNDLNESEMNNTNIQNIPICNKALN